MESSAGNIEGGFGKTVFVLATANSGKIREMRSILGAAGIDAIARSEVGIESDIEETGGTFRDNALIKARYVCKLSGMPAIADDSGLVVEALGGAPGVDTSSYGGIALTNDERCRFLIKNMENVEHRAAKFVCTVVCVFPNGDELIAEGECSGEIARSLSGENGFGFDPVFFIPQIGKTLAEISQEEKNGLSHRGAALRALVRLMAE
ncbi:MAG: RdgB/HAM1 family non-canonical purine NTP pyrophosphatase [Oscillospiraceae bacterium]|nr:RdgB/HAM1 family non-canonical purine NTP pyrophosphatase [Oscillospiraceae bacterium]